MPTAAEAVRALQEAFDAGFDPVKLSQLRGSRRSELQNRIAGDIGAGDRNAFGRDRYLAGTLDEDIAADPFTGTEAQADTEHVNDVLDSANLTNREEVGDASRTMADRSAYADFMKKLSGYRAEMAPQGAAALDAASARKVRENEAGSGAKLANQLTMLEARGVTPSAQGKSSMTALSDVEALAPTILQRLRETHPGIETDPAKYGGVGDTVSEKAKRFAYGVGLYTPDEDIGQLTQLLRVIAARPYMAGRPNQRVYDDIVSHLGEFGFSPGADYARIAKILELAPTLREGIEQGEQPIKRRPLGGAAVPPNIKVTREK